MSILDNYSDRIRFVRSLTKLTRESFEKKYGISKSTLKSWELGVNSLTEKSASLISNAINQEGFTCSPEWLIFGLGLEPRPISDKDEKIVINELTQQAQIMYEAEYFKKNHPNSITYVVADNSMEPYYHAGDYVGGIYLNINSYQILNDSPCIITLSDEITLIRKFLLSNDNSCILFPINNRYKPDVVKKENIISIASIVWHRTLAPREFFDA